MAPRWLRPALATLVLVAAGMGPARLASADQGRTHTVVEGDTLQSIAEQYGVDLRALIAANGLDAAPDLLSVGSNILLPGAQAAEQRAAVSVPSPGQRGPARTHVVQAGDTLRSIAQTYDADILSLIAVNSLDDPDLLGVGRLLILPGGAIARPAPTLAPTPTPVPTPTPNPTPTPTPARAPQSPRAPPAPMAAPAAGQVVMAMVTGYALGAGASSTRTASGATTHWGTVAADTRLYPFGTRLKIEGFDDMVFVVEDTGSAVRGNIFDVWFPDVAAARAFGGRPRRVTILP